MTSSRPSAWAPAIDPFDALKRKVSFFFGDKRDGRPSVRAFLAELGGFGEAAIVGGMLRDLLIEDYDRFASDVDLVVDSPDVPALEAFLVSRGGVRNKFGGYALPELWKIDVWPLQRTWAHVNGHQEVRVLEDILQTTFFNWDAILYLVGKRRVVASATYLEQVASRYLDVNLLPNPNRHGSLIRTMRAAARYSATLSPALTEYADRLLAEIPESAVVQGEAAAYGRRAVLTPKWMSHAAGVIAVAASKGCASVPFPLPDAQLPFPAEARAIHPVPTCSRTKVARLKRARSNLSLCRQESISLTLNHDLSQDAGSSCLGR